MKRFLSFINEAEWNRIKPSDLPPLNKDYLEKRDQERQDARMANKEVQATIPKGKAYTDRLPVDDPRSTKPGADEFKISDQSKHGAAVSGTKIVEPNVIGLKDKEIPHASKRDTTDTLKSSPPITADKGIETGKFSPPDHPTKYKNPSLRTRKAM